ncbi:MAG: hypothetical protein ACXVP5_02980 [Tumebacillaceae bacterium]
MFWAGLLSFLFPGFGQFYNRQYLRSLLFILAQMVTAFWILPSFLMNFPLVIGIYIYATVQAVGEAKKRKEVMKPLLFFVLLVLVVPAYWGEIKWISYVFRDFQ